MKKYIMSEYRDAWGNGTMKTFDNKDEAMTYTVKEWNAMCEEDKESYRKDVVGEFRCYEVELPDEQAEMLAKGELLDPESYETAELVNPLNKGGRR